jgi:hypothetical protein
MKILTPILVGTTLLFTQLTGLAQADTAKIAQKALFFADSLNKTDNYQSWSAYADLVPASVLKYYGGKDGFIEHVKKGRKRTVSSIEEEKPEMKLLSLRTENDQWQCVIRQSRYFHREDNKKYHVVTYFLGQSRDEGETWRLFDVSYNSVANIIYMLPDVFGDLAIPEPTILSEEEELARQQAAKPPAGKAKAPKKS